LGQIPRLLLVGPPGCGKSTGQGVARGQRAFFYISGSDFVEMFVGVGASRVRDLFDQAKRRAPCWCHRRAGRRRPPSRHGHGERTTSANRR